MSKATESQEHASGSSWSGLGESMGYRGWAILIVATTILVVVGFIAFLLYVPSATTLGKFRDATIIFIGVIWIFILLLLSVMVAVMVWVALLLRDRAIPLLQEILENVRDTSGTVSETAKRVKGSTEFVSEEVASPIITTYGRWAKIRKMATMFVGLDRPGKRK